MTRSEKVSVFNAALTGLLFQQTAFSSDPKTIVRLAAEYVRTADSSTVVETALE